jgi:predicted lysophospholipase L1 biosynthesis ABC-type transport system permease subunit
VWARWQFWVSHGPAWRSGVVAGTAFGLMMAGLNVVMSGQVLAPLVGGVLGGVVFGVLMGLFQSRMNRTALAATTPPGGAWTPEAWAQVGRAARGRDIPADPAVRAAAHAMVEQQARAADRSLRWVLPVLVLFGLLYVWMAATSSLWWLLALAMFAAFATLAVLQPGRLRRRAKTLHDHSE